MLLGLRRALSALRVFLSTCWSAWVGVSCEKIELAGFEVAAALVGEPLDPVGIASGGFEPGAGVSPWTASDPQVGCSDVRVGISVVDDWASKTVIAGDKQFDFVAWIVVVPTMARAVLVGVADADGDAAPGDAAGSDFAGLEGWHLANSGHGTEEWEHVPICGPAHGLSGVVEVAGGGIVAGQRADSFHAHPVDVVFGEAVIPSGVLAALVIEAVAQGDDFDRGQFPEIR